jgi:hypothetical protein
VRGAGHRHFRTGLNRFPNSNPSPVKSHFLCPTITTSKMARADKSALVKKAVSVIKRGEFRDYSKAAAYYSYDRTVTTPAELVLSPRDLLTALGLSEITHKDRLLSCHLLFLLYLLF